MINKQLIWTLGIIIINIIGVLKGVHLGLLGKSHVPFLTTVTPSGSGSRRLNWCKVSQCWDTNNQLELEPPLHKQLYCPWWTNSFWNSSRQHVSTDCTIFPDDIPAFQTRGSSALTLCRLAVGGFGFVEFSHAGPRLGLHINTVYILKNTRKSQACLYSELHSAPQTEPYRSPARAAPHDSQWSPYLSNTRPAPIDISKLSSDWLSLKKQKSDSSTPASVWCNSDPRVEKNRLSV